MFILLKLLSAVIYIVKTLCFSIKGMFRRPSTLKNVGIFLSCSGVLWIGTHIASSYMAYEPVLVWLFGWLWIPLSLLFLIIRHGEVIRRHKLKKFFERKEFKAYNGKIPKYLNTSILNRYLKKIRFKSQIPYDRWERIVSDLEVFFEKRILKIINLPESITKVDILVIDENLPNYIEWDDSFIMDGRKFVIGQGYQGKCVWDAASLAHGIVAGATGGGKTAILRVIIYQAIKKRFNVQILDFKGGGDFAAIDRERQKYIDLEDGSGTYIISEPKEAEKFLTSLLIEVRNRLDHFKKEGVSNIEEFNTLGKLRFIPWLLVIDEAAEVLNVKPKTKEEKEAYESIDQSLRTLARLSRAAGVHILMGIIRPSTDILDGQVKNNLLWRACAYFADEAASQLVLGNDKATRLPPNMKGRFVVGDDEVQAYYLPQKAE